MKSSMLNSKIIVAFIFNLLCFLFPTSDLFAQRTDFSGTWTINSEKSEFGNVHPSSFSTQLKVYQKKDSIIIERVGENTLFQTYRFDGSSTETKMPENKKRIASISWLENGQILVEKAQTIYDGGQQKTTTTYTRSVKVCHELENR